MVSDGGRANLFALVSSVLVIAITSLTLYVMFRLRASSFDKRRCPPKTFAFFHPYASGGGGGERVLWKMIQYLQQMEAPSAASGTATTRQSTAHANDLEIIIYTVDPPSTKEQELRQDAERRFDVQIPKPIRLVSLEEYKDCLQPRPFLSLVMESYGTMKLVREALRKLQQPDIFCDTTGCAFTFVVVRWMCPTTTIMTYVHYPTISTDMMLWEWTKHSDSTIVQRIKTMIKLIYYWFFAISYGLVGSMADLVMVNSTWTYNHIASLWRFSSHPIQIVFPPCRVPEIAAVKATTKRRRTIVSIGQFRPEKNHKLQLEALQMLFQRHPELKTNIDPVHLLLIGSCRNDADQGRLDELRDLAKQLGLQDHVVFNVNPPYNELQASMSNASMGIHTMRQEHFGIGIVEMMAAGLLVIAHNSGGPQSDIVDPGRSGFLAVTAEEYAAAIHQALTMDTEADVTMRLTAQQSALRFSDSEFDKNLENAFKTILWY